MKRYRLIYAALMLAVIVLVSSCTQNYADYNTNPYEVTSDEMERDSYNISSALVNMQNWVIPTSVNGFQFVECLFAGSYSGYLADSNAGFVEKFSTYNPPFNWESVPFNDLTPQVYASYILLTTLTDDAPSVAIADIVRISAMALMTDTYGPIPYSKIGVDGELTAPYDSQQMVYESFFDELDAAIETLTENQNSAISANADKIYDGNIIKWIRYANSLKLRLAMRVVYADEALAQREAEEVAAHSIGGLESNDDNAFLPSTNNPFKVIMYDYNEGDSRIGADLTSYMNGYNDPRREKYFTESTFSDYTNGYHGFRSGIIIPDDDMIKQFSNMVTSTTSSIMWMNASETAFLKAEAALRGWNMGGTAEDFYNQGVELSFAQWGASGADDYLADSSSVAKSYVDPMGINSYNGITSTVKIKWSSTADFEENLERIITQKWIANFPLGRESWSEFRRTGYPKLMPVVTNNSGGVVDNNLMVRRLTYPSEEYSENGDNVNDALVSLGGADLMSTRVWWDCNPNVN